VVRGERSGKICVGLIVQNKGRQGRFCVQRLVGLYHRIFYGKAVRVAIKQDKAALFKRAVAGIKHCID